MYRIFKITLYYSLNHIQFYIVYDQRNVNGIASFIRKVLENKI